MNRRLEELNKKQILDLQQLVLKKRQTADYTHIPDELWCYCENALNRLRTDDSLLLALCNDGIDVIFSDLNRLFQKACKITQYDINELISALDFDPHDIEKGRIDSFLAEVRAIFFLSEEGFKDIEPLERKKKRKQCDVFAWRGSKKFAVEVSHTAERPIPDSYDDREFVYDLCNRFRDKKCQVDASLNMDDCHYGLFVYVLDRFAHQLDTSKCRFNKNLRCVYKELNWGEQYYFAIVTGNSISGSPLEDSIYPPLKLA